MQTIETLYTFRTRNFRLVVRAVEEPDPDFSFDDTGETLEKCRSGEWQVFGVIAEIFGPHGEEIAHDSLWNCIYADPAEFRDHVGIRAKARADGHNYGSYFSDMVREVCGQARKRICELSSLKVRCA